MENSIKEDEQGTICVSAKGAPGLYRPAPPYSTPPQGGCKTALSKFSKTRNFDKIILNFAKLEENLAKHEIKKFSRKFPEITKTKLVAGTLLLHNLPSATHPPLLSAKRFFIAALQCYLHLKTLKEPYFSILSSIILWIEYYFCTVCGINFIVTVKPEYWHDGIGVLHSFCVKIKFQDYLNHVSVKISILLEAKSVQSVQGFTRRRRKFSKSQEILGNSRKSWQILANPSKSQQILANPSKPQQILGNPRKSQ